jgi:C4-dicarboxylate-specific signal transduction histidine kinase
MREHVRQIREGATRVAGIVQRLLTFARQRKSLRAAVDMNEVILSTLALREAIEKVVKAALRSWDWLGANACVHAGSRVNNTKRERGDTWHSRIA